MGLLYLAELGRSHELPSFCLALVKGQDGILVKISSIWLWQSTD